MARLLASVVWTLLFGLLALSLRSDHQERKRAHVLEQMGLLTSRIDATVESLSAFSHYAWETSVLQPRVTAVVRRAWEGTQAERARLRRELHALLLPQYERMTRFHFRQVHFHFPDGTTFLRMHSPADFGDDVSSVRLTVKLANETHRPAAGFEEGRTANGYRFVYPLFDGEVHCGTVELSFSMESFLEVLGRLSEAGFAFAVERAAVESAVSERNLDHYADSPLSPLLMADREVPGDPRVEAVLGATSFNLGRAIRAGNDFGLAQRHEGEPWLALFKAVRNVRGKNVAWIVSVAKAPAISRLDADIRRLLLLAGLGWLAVMAVSWLFLTDRQKLARLSATDPLTGAMNRRSFIQRATHAMSESRQCGAPLGLIVLDIDHFKAFNDTWGHNEGDRVLVETAHLVSGLVRAGDAVARWGGEEFVVLLPCCALGAAAQVAEKIRAGIAQAPLGRGGPVTVSAGVAAHAPGESFDALVARADAGLYESKKGGRNRVTVR